MRRGGFNFASSTEKGAKRWIFIEDIISRGKRGGRVVGSAGCINGGIALGVGLFRVEVTARSFLPLGLRTDHCLVL